MDTSPRNKQEGAQTTAVAALLTGALVWGLIWYPYRVMRDNGIDGIVAPTLTYAVAFLLGLFFFRKTLRSWRPRKTDIAKLLWLSLAAGGCNLGYVLATLHGEVVRVLLLFYLAPLWTVLLSRLLLKEELSHFGAFVVALSLAGAVTILWTPSAGFPYPRDVADWLGLGASLSFALFNVLSRYIDTTPIEVKSMVSFAGVTLLGGILLLAGMGSPALPWHMDIASGAYLWGMVALIGLILVVINLVVQFGLARLAANRAIVIMLTEIGVAAASAWLLAGESFGWREIIGGLMIIAASALSARPREKKRDERL